jgi:hypothetical protein
MTFEGHREVIDEEDFLPLLLSVNGQFERDGTRPHTANAILDALNKHFDNRDISNRFHGWSGHHSLPASISVINFHWDM